MLYNTITKSGQPRTQKRMFDELAMQCSQLTTRKYSTSFSIGIRCLAPELRDPIHAIYGFVRFADEIVDSFHSFDRRELLDRFRKDTQRAIDERISLNPILNSFQAVVHKYRINMELISRFLESMEMDLNRQRHEQETYSAYVYGSAEVVGLMCLRVFCAQQPKLYNKLIPHALSLGAAFQKVNFLRDFKADYEELGRVYFPGVDPERFDGNAKRTIEESIQRDFDHAFEGIRGLPSGAQFGVYVAYVYYLALFKKIKNTSNERILTARIRIAAHQKAFLLASCFCKYRLGRLDAA